MKPSNFTLNHKYKKKINGLFQNRYQKNIGKFFFFGSTMKYSENSKKFKYKILKDNILQYNIRRRRRNITVFEYLLLEFRHYNLI